MQLTVRDVSRFLDVSDSTVTRWVKQKGLPFHHVGGQYRFNRAELLEWATPHQIKVSTDLFDQPESEQEAVPTLAEALEDGGSSTASSRPTRSRRSAPSSRYFRSPMASTATQSCSPSWRESRTR